jgi:mannosyltransferase OCH1-like enzyme
MQYCQALILTAFLIPFLQATPKETFQSAPWAKTYSDKGIAPWVYIDFDESMQTAAYTNEIAATTRITGIDGNILYHSLKGLYNKNNLSNILPSKKLLIPRIIHQIWLGSPVPECYKSYMTSWIEFHLDDWQYMLWTEKEITELNLYNKKYYDESDNYGIKADIARAEILYQFGGVYIETDFECLRPLDILHYTYDFYIGIQPLDSQFLQLGIGIIGSRAGHPILKHCIESIKDDWHKKGAPQKTGPIHFTMSFYLMSDLYGNVDIAFPASYFYPLGCYQKDVDKQAWTIKGAFGAHWWSKSWMPASYRPYQFKSINNEASTKNWNS